MQEAAVVDQPDKSSTYWWVGGSSDSEWMMQYVTISTMHLSYVLLSPQWRPVGHGQNVDRSFNHLQAGTTSFRPLAAKQTGVCAEYRKRCTSTQGVHFSMFTYAAALNIYCRRSDHTVDGVHAYSLLVQMYSGI